MSFGLTENYRCALCTFFVILEPSMSKDYDYAWSCSNACCLHSNAQEGTGDMDQPQWVVTSTELARYKANPGWMIEDLANKIGWQRTHIAALEAQGVSQYPLMQASYERHLTRLRHFLQMSDDLAEI